MTYQQYNRLCRDSLDYETAEDFIGAVGYPDWAGDDPTQWAADLENIWTVSHMTVKDMRKACGMTQEKLSEYLDIPKRTIQNWDSEHRAPAPYVARMIADLLGLITVERRWDDE